LYVYTKTVKIIAKRSRVRLIERDLL